LILLDTNVLSALMRDQPDAAVVAWLDAQDPARIWTTAVTIFEIRYGLARLPRGRKRAALSEAFDGLLREELAGRVASLDRSASEAAGDLAARREGAGQNVDVRDTMIAGIALARRASIATRNARHFADAGMELINPWAG
jgi:predicted nucleic acid-binding protein